MSGRWSREAPVLVVAVVLAAANALGLAPGILGLFHDDGIYAAVAKSLAEGTGYRIVSLPTAPFQAKYPVLYPGLLSVIWRVAPAFPGNVMLLKLVNILALLAALVAAAYLYRRHAGSNGIGEMAVLVLTATNVLVVGFARMALSETLFLAFGIIALALAASRGTGQVTALAVLSAGAYLTRTAGLALILAIVLHLVWKRTYRDGVRFAFLTVFCLSPWIVWQGLHREVPSSVLLGYYVAYDLSSSAYPMLLHDARQALQVLAGNVRYAVEFIDTILFLPAVPGLRLVVYPAIVAGALRRGTDSGWLLHIFGASYLALVVGWPWHPGRFLVPVVPILMIFAMTGMREGFSAIRRGAYRMGFVVRWLVVGLCAAPVMLQLCWFSLYLGQREPPPFANGERQWSGFVETFAWVRQHTEPGAVLATAFDPMYYLYTGRRGVRPWLYKPTTYFYPHGAQTPDLGRVEDIKPELMRLGVAYLIVDPMDDFAEKKAAEALFDELLDSYVVRPKPSFVSSDGLHRVYRLPTGHADAAVPPALQEGSWPNASR